MARVALSTATTCWHGFRWTSPPLIVWETSWRRFDSKAVWACQYQFTVRIIEGLVFLPRTSNLNGVTKDHYIFGTMCQNSLLEASDCRSAEFISFFSNTLKHGKLNFCSENSDCKRQVLCCTTDYSPVVIKKLDLFWHCSKGILCPFFTTAELLGGDVGYNGKLSVKTHGMEKLAAFLTLGL